MDNKSVSVIDTATNNVIGMVNVGFDPLGVGVNSAGTEIYVANEDGTVSIIDTSTNKVTATVKVGGYPYGIAVTPDGTKIYVADRDSNNVYVIDTATNKVGSYSKSRRGCGWGCSNP
jgi:YVTN family beta-propeller protein